MASEVEEGLLPTGLSGRIEMRTPDEVSAMLALKACGWGTKRIAAELGCSRNTVRRWLVEGVCLPFEPDAAHLFYQLVSRRYERGAMLVTSNRAVGEWGTVFGDPVVATAILDRLLHHSHVVTIRGESYRRREKRRSGLLQKAAPAPETPTVSKE